MLYSNSLTVLLQFLSLFVFIFLEKKNLEKKFFTTPIIYVLYDSFMHLCYFMIVAMPLLRFKEEFLFGCALSILIDLDHIIEARSLKISNLLSLGRRPWTHSLIFALFATAVVFIAAKNSHLSFIVLISLLSHLLRDLSEGKTYIFFPSKRFYSYGFSYYVLSSAVLALAVNLAYYLFNY
ncbi:MAG: metal-dependent hydrolase [bacterium]